MATPSATTPVTGSSGLPGKQAYVVAALSFAAGLTIGHFTLNVRSSAAGTRMRPTPAASAPSTAGGHRQLNLDQMKDVQASTLIEKSKADPKNASLLVQIAGIYQSTQQFKEAASYFQNALTLEPKNLAAGTELASCLYYSGDVDSALTELNEALKYARSDANAIFNLGMITYRGKTTRRGQSRPGNYC